VQCRRFPDHRRELRAESHRLRDSTRQPTDARRVLVVVRVTALGDVGEALEVLESRPFELVTQVLL